MAGAQILRTDVHVDREGTSVLLPAGGPVPAWAKDLVTNPKAFVSAEAEQESGEESDDDTRTVEELKAELKQRELPVKGNREELIARLAAADAEAEQESGEESDDDQEQQEA